MNYYLASVVYPEKYNINLLKIFGSEDTANQTLVNLCLDDDLVLRLFFDIISEESGLSRDEFLQQVDGKDLGQFREDFWAEVVNFSDALKKPILQEMWKQVRKDLKKALTNDNTDSVSSTT